MWHQRFAAFLLMLAVWTCDSASGQKEKGERGSKCCAQRLDRLLDNMTALRGEVRQIEDVEDKLTTLGQTADDLSTQMIKLQRALTEIQNGIALTCKAPQLPPLIDDKLVRDSEGYYLAFRLTAGIKKSAYAKYTHAGYNDDESDLMHHKVPCGCKSTNGSLHCDRHYRSMLMDRWPHLPVEKVRVSLYKAGVEERRFVFDGRHSDSLSFFEQARLRQDQYNDLSSYAPNNPRPNFFSITGHVSVARRFFINNNYGGCHVDKGWLVVGDRDRNLPCAWERRYQSNYPFILYAADTISGVQGYVKSNWQSGTVGVADVLTVSIKLRDQEECQADSN